MPGRQASRNLGFKMETEMTELNGEARGVGRRGRTPRCGASRLPVRPQAPFCVPQLARRRGTGTLRAQQAPRNATQATRRPRDVAQNLTCLQGFLLDSGGRGRPLGRSIGPHEAVAQAFPRMQCTLTS